MVITNAKYNAHDGQNCSVNAVIDGTEISVPLNPDNRHYAAILEWVAEGNTIQDAD